MRRSNAQLEAAIKRRLNQGRGLGDGVNYKPWLTVREVPSHGKSSRILGWKTHREHVVLSGLEEHYFYTLEWSESVVDVREQFPLLPVEETLSIAESLGVRHPEHHGTLIVMTLDFLVTVLCPDGRRRFCARSVKPKAELADRRVREKLSIERLFCEAHGMDWGYVTEEHIPWVLAENVAYLHSRHDLTHQSSQIDASIIPLVSRVLAAKVLGSDIPLNRHTCECDDLLGLAPGTSLTIVRHLLAVRRWTMDMDQPIHPAKPLRLLAVHNDAPSRQHAA